MSLLPYPLRDKVAIITGASTGIGRAVALELARRGCRLALAARSADKLEEVRGRIESLGAQAIAVRTDVTRPEQIALLVQTTVDRFGGVDVLVNNAGYGLWGTFANLPPGEIRKIFDTNVFGAVAMAQAVIPELRKRGGGQIVNIESIVGLRSMPGASAYCATKHALHAFSESMRIELAPWNIHVCSFCPGLTASDFSKNKVEIDFHTQLSKLWSQPAEKCARLIVRAIRWRRRQVVTTWSGKMFCVIQRLSPRINDWIFRAGQKLGMAP